MGPKRGHRRRQEGLSQSARKSQRGEATVAEMEAEDPGCLAQRCSGPACGRGCTSTAPARLRAWEDAVITMFKATGSRGKKEPGSLIPARLHR